MRRRIVQADERARLAQELQHLHASVCSALSDPTRIAILYELADQPHHVSELVELLNLPQSSVSRHLKTLRDHRLVHAERQGANVVYSLADRRVIAALDLLRQVLAESLAVNAALAEVLEEPHLAV
jgi:DNA-binding transcriptional ArsR family regulator